MPKKEISGGRRRRQSKQGIRARKGNMARAQEIAFWGCRGIGSLWLPIQSKSRTLPQGKSFLLLSHPAPKVLVLARTVPCGESTSRVSILALLERHLQGRLERRGYQRVKRRASVAPIASLCHHPFHREHIPMFSICSVLHAPLLCPNMQRYLGNA